MIYQLRRRNRYQRLNDIPLTPLIDVALTLLVVFLIATPVCQNSIKISLPYGKVNEQASKLAKLIINISNENCIYVNGHEINSQNLIADLAVKVAKGEDAVFIRADKSVNYGFLIKVIDQVKSIPEVKNVFLLTNKAG